MWYRKQEQTMCMAIFSNAAILASAVDGIMVIIRKRKILLEDLPTIQCEISKKKFWKNHHVLIVCDRVKQLRKRYSYKYAV